MACAVLMLAAACASEQTATTLTSDGTISVCADTGECADLPAAGATVTVFDETGDQAEEGILDPQGVLEFDMRAGTYTAALAMPSLGIGTRPAGAEVSIAEGGSGDLSIWLPRVDVTSVR